MTAGLPDRATDRERECTCCPPGKRPAIEHAKGCPRRAPRTVPLSASSVGEQIAALAPDRRQDQRANGRVHELKTWPGYFDAVAEGRKTYELRRDDRGYAVGDVLRLREWTPAGHAYTGREIERLVTHVLRDAPGFGLVDGFALLSFAAASPVPGQQREAVADELARHTDTLSYTRDDDTVCLGCRCGFERGTVTKAGLAANLDGWMRAHRLHVADTVIALLDAGRDGGQA